MFVTDWQYCTFHRLGGVVYPSSTSDSLTAAACAWHATGVITRGLAYSEPLCPSAAAGTSAVH
jgi:hypothetical protein